MVRSSFLGGDEMAYYRRRRSTRYSRGGGMRRYSTRRRSYGRRRRSYGLRQQRIVIQVVGGAGGVATASPVTIGQKSARVVRRRF